LPAKPLLAVLRPRSTPEAHCQLELLQAVGLVHVELAVQASQAWSLGVRGLAKAFPALRLGAASVTSFDHLDAVAAAGLAYAVSPILDAELLQRAGQLGLTLVPGVQSPTEVHQAQKWGCSLVKLFPARPLGPSYWPSLAGPLGPLPFCIAAGGLACTDVLPWLDQGVDAVALGGRLFGPSPGQDPAQASEALIDVAQELGTLDPQLAGLVQQLAKRGHQRPH
jgi:2-dehydro-3-deoxyphosphogluconate aldolase/(4S)-4-hydroxy-2-oxoglutarate aldolase